MAKINKGNIILEKDDVYNFDILLSDILVQGLTLLMEHKKSIPQEVYERCNDDIKKASNEFNTDLKKMIDIFALTKDRLDDNYDDTFGSPYDHTKVWFDEQNKFEPKYLPDWSEEDIAKWHDDKNAYYEKLKADREEAMNLLNQYFDNLWT